MRNPKVGLLKGLRLILAVFARAQRIFARSMESVISIHIKELCDWASNCDNEFLFDSTAFALSVPVKTSSVAAANLNAAHNAGGEGGSMNHTPSDKRDVNSVSLANRTSEALTTNSSTAIAARPSGALVSAKQSQSKKTVSIGQSPQP